MLNGYMYDVREVRACDAMDEPGFTLLGQSGRQGAAGRGPAWERLAAQKCMVHRGRQDDPTSRTRTWIAPRARVTGAFEPQGGRPDTMSTTKGLSWQNTAEGATEEPGRGVSGGETRAGR